MREAEGSKGRILFFVVSPVHVRNARLLAPLLDGWEFVLVYESRLPWLHPGSLHPFRTIAVSDGAVPGSVWADDVHALILSTAQARWPTTELVKSAIATGRPTIAIEESHQLALTGHHNYLLPVDRLCVASDAEREALVRAGFSSQSIEVTGWPFYSGLFDGEGERSPAEIRRSLGLDVRRPVATVALTLDATGYEGEHVRAALLRLIDRGLPQQYQMLVKPHPIEARSRIEAIAARHAPRARVLEPGIDINDVLKVTDVLLNRGMSQVVIEALLRTVPVVIVPMGQRTVFHEASPRAIAETSEGVAAAVAEAVADPAGPHSRFLDTHLSIRPDEAIGRVRRAIVDQVGRGPVSDRPGRLLQVALYEAWQVSSARAMDTVALASQMGAEPALRSSVGRIVMGQGGGEDLPVVLQAWGEGFLAHVTRSLVLRSSLQKGVCDDAPWLRGYPPEMNRFLFLKESVDWGNALLSTGQVRPAGQLAARLRPFQHVEAVAEFMEKVDLQGASIIRCVSVRGMRRLTRAGRFAGRRVRAGIGRFKELPARILRRGRRVGRCDDREQTEGVQE